MRKTLLFLLFLFSVLISRAQNDTVCVQLPSTDEHATFSEVKADSMTKSSFLRSHFNNIIKRISDFFDIDTTFIEPQHYDYTVMWQNTNTYEAYTLRTKDEHRVRLSPEPSLKIGPYFGWKWLFLGYTIDVAHLKDGHNKQDFDISLYSNQVGVDLFYRKSGNDYRIRSVNLGNDINTRELHNVAFGGISSSVKGFNLYYIVNHKRFSYPAAFSQSTCQKRSVGSWMFGIGYTKHVLNINVAELYDIYKIRLGDKYYEANIDETMTEVKVNYTDYAASFGYGYNWVFAPRWLFAASLSLAFGAKHTTGDTQHTLFELRDFSLSNFNIDGVGRFGIVWNNTRWYAGASAIMHSYHYSKQQFSTNSMFGNVNVYLGFNFKKKKR